MTVHRIDHAVVIDTDDIPGRGGYAVVGISPGVSPAERAFIAGNFGISDYLHDPKTENRIFYSVFQVPGGRRAFVRRFARGSELRRNNTQRRLVIHTLLLSAEVWNELFALPWLLLNARLQLEGTNTPYRLSTDVPWSDESETLPALLWDTGDNAATGVAAKLGSRVETIGSERVGGVAEARELIARVITTLASRSRVVLPQDPQFELVTMLAWSMLPRHDRDELGWTHHDAMNLSGVTFPLANAPAGAFDAASSPSATFAQELVRMNTESEETWLDVEERTARHPLTVRKPDDLDSWMRWRDALMRLRENIGAPEGQVIAYMARLAKVVNDNPTATWIDAEETLDLVWSNVAHAIDTGTAAEVAVTTWGRRLRSSGLGDVIFRAAPGARWLTRAAADTRADSLVWFFLAGGGEDAASKSTRESIAQWLVSTHDHAVSKEHLAMLAFLVAADGSPTLQSLLELLLETSAGLDALLGYLRKRQAGGVHLIHTAAPIMLARDHRHTLAFFRDVFVPRCEPQRVDSKLARVIANVLREDSQAFSAFARRLPLGVKVDLITLLRHWVEAEPAATLPLARVVLADLQQQEGGIASAGPLAITLAHAGEPARTWFDVLLRIARTADPRSDAEGTRDFLTMLGRIEKPRLDLTGSMERLVPILEGDELKSAEAVRALILLTRPVWASGGNQFVRAVRRLIERAPLAGAWQEIVLAYAADHRNSRDADVSDLAAAFWSKADRAQMETMDPAAIALLDQVNPAGVQRLRAAWGSRLRSLPMCPAAERLLALLRQGRSYKQEIDLAIREIEHGVATPQTLNCLEAALARVSAGSAASQFAGEIEIYLGAGGPAPRLTRLLDLFASDEILPTVRLALQTRVLAKALKVMKRRHWKELRTAARDENLLAAGVVVRLAYAVGAGADRRTIEEFERTWRANGRNDALDALAGGRDARRPMRWLARAMGFGGLSPLAQ